MEKLTINEEILNKLQDNFKYYKKTKENTYLEKIGEILNDMQDYKNAVWEQKVWFSKRENKQCLDKYIIAKSRAKDILAKYN